MGEIGDIKFSTEVDHNSWYMDYKNPQMGHGRGHVTHFKFWGPSHIIRIAEATVIKFCAQAVLSASIKMARQSQEAWL